MNLTSVAQNSPRASFESYLYKAFLALLIWAPLPLGSNRQWSSLLLLFISAGLLALWLLLYLQEKVDIPKAAYRARWAIACLLGFQLWVLLQTLALPVFLAQIIIPDTFQLYQDSGFSEHQVISLDRSATLQAFLVGMAISLAFILALLLINSEQRRRWFYMALVFSGVIQATYGIIMVLTNNETLLHLETFLHRHNSTASGTFVNSNHFAGYLNLCLAMGVGLLLSQLSSKKITGWREYIRQLIETLMSPKAALRVFLAILVVGLVMSHSRMGNLAFFIALSGTAAIYLFRRNKKSRLDFNALILFASIIIIDTVVVGSWFGLDKVVERIENTKLSGNTRIGINQRSISILQDYFITGVGADAYQVIEPAYTSEMSDTHTKHAHNDYLEFLVTTGLVGVTLLLVFLSLVVYSLYDRPKSKGTGKDKMDYGLVMLLIYLAAHSSADFNLQIPAFAFTVLACLALAFIKNSDEPSASRTELDRQK